MKDRFETVKIEYKNKNKNNLWYQDSFPRVQASSWYLVRRLKIFDNLGTKVPRLSKLKKSRDQVPRLRKSKILVPGTKVTANHQFSRFVNHNFLI